MAYQFPPDIDQRVKSQLATGQYRTEDDVLREALDALRRQDEELQAIREGIADMEAGRYRPLDEVDAEIRDKHGFPQDA